MTWSVRHHQHLRKRLSRFQNYPHPKFWMRMLDRAVLVTGVVSPLMTIPQLYKIYSTLDATGVSAISWGAFAFFDIPFILYGIAHKEPPIVITYTMWLCMNAAVMIGALLYG